MQTLAGPLLIILAFLVNQTLTVRLARLPAEKVSDHTVSRLAAFDGVLTAVAYGAAVFVGMRAGKTDALWAVCLSGILLLLLLLLEIFLRRWAVAWSSDRDLLYRMMAVLPTGLLLYSVWPVIGVLIGFGLATGMKG